jgi:hypothetical protein
VRRRQGKDVLLMSDDSYKSYEWKLSKTRRRPLQHIQT